MLHLKCYTQQTGNNVKDKWPNFHTLEIFGAPLPFQFRFIWRIGWALLNAWNWTVVLKLNVYSLVTWIFYQLFLVLTSVLLLKDVDVNKLWRTADSNGWRASSAPRTYWPRKFLTVSQRQLLSSCIPSVNEYTDMVSLCFAAPPTESESNGYLRVRCNGGLNQQRSAVWLRQETYL